MLQFFWNGYKAFKKWRQNIGLHIREVICWPFRAWFWCHIFVLFFLRPIYCDRELCHGKNWKSFWKYMPGEMCTYFCLDHSSIRGLFKGLYISPSLAHLLWFTVFSKGLFFPVWGLMSYHDFPLEGPYIIWSLRISPMKSYRIEKVLVHLGKLGGQLLFVVIHVVQILAKARNKNVNFMSKNNGHQNFTLSLGVPEPPFPLV